MNQARRRELSRADYSYDDEIPVYEEEAPATDAPLGEYGAGDATEAPLGSYEAASTEARDARSRFRGGRGRTSSRRGRSRGRGRTTTSREVETIH